MAYTNAIFYMDYALPGVDTARATLSGVVFSNPGGTTVRGHYVAHGLVTGACIQVSATTNGNGVYKITYYDADNFDLDATLWANFNGADVTGDVVPFGGQSWADAWKTLTAGATAQRIAPGDIIRMAQSPIPVTLGNATWTDKSKTVTLAQAKTLDICLCENSNWTGANDGTGAVVGVATDGKQGSYCQQVTMDSATQANKLQAYWATGDLTLADYQRISFWFKNSAAVADATTWTITLCSDTAGATAVDTFVIQPIASINVWVPLTIARTGGGNLGGGGLIKSIALNSGATAPTNSCNVLMDNFMACATDGLNLQSLISKNSALQGGTESWYGIQSISGVTVLLDNGAATKASAGRGYSTAGTTPQTVETFRRETIKTILGTAAATVVQQIMDVGTSGNNIQFQGGYDVSNTQQTGETFFDGSNGYGYGIYFTTKNYLTLNHLGCFRYNYGLYGAGGSAYVTITSLFAANNGDGLITATNAYWIITAINANNNITSGITLSGNDSQVATINDASNNLQRGLSSTERNLVIGQIGNASNNGATGLYIDGGAQGIYRIGKCAAVNNNVQYAVVLAGTSFTTIRSLSTTGNGTAAIYAVSPRTYLENANLTEGTEIAGLTAGANGLVFSTNHDAGTNHWLFTDGGTINSAATDRAGGTGLMWKFIPGTTRTSWYPLKLSIAKVACVASKAVTVKAYMKKDHATNVFGQLVLSGGQLGMAVADVTADASSADTNWHEITLADFTPVIAGVVEIEAWAWYVAGASNVYVSDMTITQAD
jgi:hypothetical protein